MRYLVATDGSEPSDKAVRYASAQAIAFDATLEIVHVLQPETELRDGEIVLPGENRATERGEQVLEQARRLAAGIVDERGDDVPLETQLLTGRPAEAISEYARGTETDAIYVGHRGLSEELVGGVAKSIVGKATVPVTVVR